MPKIANDYSKAKIYKMSCPEGFYYIGHTCSSLRQRKSNHKYHSESLSHRKVYDHFSRVGWDLVEMKVVEEVTDAKTLVDVARVEDRHIKEALDDEKCLNTIRAFTTPDEKKDQQKDVWNNRTSEQVERKKVTNKEWVNNNPDRVKEINKKAQAKRVADGRKAEDDKRFREKHKVELRQRACTKVICDRCGETGTRQNIPRHKKSKKCLDFSNPDQENSSLNSDN